MRKLGYLLIVLLFVACSAQPDLDVTLHRCASMPSARACATAFVVNNRAYVFAGRDSSNIAQNDLWQYDPVTDSWTALGATPLSPRVNATACVLEDKVYIGLGFNGTYKNDTSFFQDWWEYTPSTDTWKALSPYPNRYTDRATAFTGTDELYVGYGFCYQYRRDFFRYDIATDRWDSIDVNVSFHGYPTRSFGGTGTTCQHRHFMGTGYYRYSLDWWAELVDGTRWEKRTPVPGRTRTLAASAATNDYIYLCGGLHYGGVNTTGEVLQDIRRYDPLTDQWTYVAIMPQGLMNHICFTSGNRIYFGLGETDEWKVQNELYYFEE